MGRVIKPGSASTERNRIARSIVLAIRELMQQAIPDHHSRDLASYVVLALLEISESVENSVAAWEKRGYWVKADRFRLEWEWAGQIGESMKTALLSNNWKTLADQSIKVMSKLHNIKIPERHRLGTPWVGAWDVFQRKFNS